MIRRVVIVALGLALMWSAAAHAQTYPARSVKLVVTFAAGGAADNWYGLVAPAGLPPELREKVYRAAIAALKNSELNRQFATLNVVADPVTPQELAAFIRAEPAKWRPVVAKTGVRLD